MGLFVAGLPASASAQWPTSYTDAKTLASGPNFRAAAVMALPDTSLIVVHPAMTQGELDFLASRFTENGHKVWSNRSILKKKRIVSTQLFVEEDGTRFSTFAALADPRLMDKAQSRAVVSYSSIANGYWSSSYFSTNYQLGKSAVLLQNKKLLRLMHDATSHTLQSTVLNSGVFRSDVFPGSLSDFATLATNDNKAVIAYTQNAPENETAGHVMYAVSSATGFVSNPTRVADQGAESQYAAQITKSGNGFMVTWLGNLNGQTRLYSKVVTSSGAVTHETRLLASDVINYSCTPSTFGVPVIAGVMRAINGNTATDTLFAGLVDPSNGNSITLPLLQGFGYKIKYFHQETNGDFTLAYSVPENGTNLLKVRRISGTTVETLWETTVADLGNASDEFIKEHPNTWVAGNPDGSYYIATRFDQRYSENTKLSVVRLRSDGLLGGESDLQEPTNFVTEVLPGGQVKLTWKDNSPAESSYLVGRTLTDFAGLELVGILPQNAESFTDTTAAPGNTYTYYVAPFKASTGDYVLSEEQSVTIP